MASSEEQDGVTPGATGRGYFFIGVLLFIAGLVIYGVVAFGLKRLTAPWYLPTLAAAGVVLMLFATLLRRSVLRIVGLVFFALLLAGEVWYLTAYSVLPQYTGPVVIGQYVPDFEISLADGRPFGSSDLRGGAATALIFFRGRW